MFFLFEESDYSLKIPHIVETLHFPPLCIPALDWHAIRPQDLPVEFKSYVSGPALCPCWLPKQK